MIFHVVPLNHSLFLSLALGRNELPQGVRMTKEAYGIHGITREDLDGCVYNWRSFIAFSQQVKGTRSKLVVVGHNITKFDLPRIVNSLIRENIDPDELPFTHIVDTLTLFKNCKAMWNASKYKYPKDSTIFESFKLGALYKYVFGKELPNAHSALSDTKANLKLLLELDPELKYTMNELEDFRGWLKTFLEKRSKEDKEWNRIK